MLIAAVISVSTAALVMMVRISPSQPFWIWLTSLVFSTQMVQMPVPESKLPAVALWDTYSLAFRQVTVT